MNGIHNTKTQVVWSIMIAPVVFILWMAPNVVLFGFDDVFFSRIRENPIRFSVGLVVASLFFSIFLFAFIRAISIVTSFPHIGWRRLLLALGILGALISVLVSLSGSGRWSTTYLVVENTSELLAGVVVGFAVAPVLLGDGFRLWTWVREGFANPSGESGDNGNGR